ncbi:MAG: 50S ribosomal protein L5 [Candidatus Levybacteria bacterium]|nr:50S ribosomal protein L5 [Candidatus Levybacteria bacterium]
MDNLQQRFKKEIASKLKEELGIKNVHQIPSMVKIVVNMGVKDAVIDKKNLELAKEQLTQVVGQKPKITKAKTSIAAFKLREGDKIGLVVTLRGRRMYEFFEKLVNVVFPRLRDFHGISKDSFDGRGNFTLGFSETTVFPEIDPGKVEKAQGLEITIVTNAKDDKKAASLLTALGMPFQK